MMEEQIRPESRKQYDTRHWPRTSIQVLASNACHWAAQRGKVTPEDVVRLHPLINSPDIENIILALCIIEEKTGEAIQYIEPKSTQDVSHIPLKESQVREPGS
jgi:hypothetical protein